jgi:hypothetical protein
MADIFQIGIREFKAGFFTSEEIKKKLEAGQQRALSKAGSYVQRRMKSSIRYRKKTSAVGQTPSAHRSESFTREKKSKSGAVSRQNVSPLRELIFFAYDSKTKSTVIGPAKFGAKGGKAPPTLEKGGPATIVTPIPRPRGRKASPSQSEAFRRKVKEGSIIVPAREYERKPIVVAPRPFVRPAGETESRSEKFKAVMKQLVR